MKKWNPEMVNTILKNENYTGTLLQGKRRKLNLSNITRLELENKVKCIYIDKNKNIKIDIK